jgi:hypothetical protein
MFRRICRAMAAAALLAGTGPEGATAAPALATIQDVLYKADGTRFNGTLTISWNSFQAADNSAIVTQSTTVKVQDGLLRVQLVPSTTGTPSMVYTVTYNSDGRVQFQETWSVPSSLQPLRVRDVRISAGALTGSASSDTSTITEASVTGLVADLGARPVKSPTFSPGRTAVVDSIGLISTAAGSPTDCVHVDGSSGPCGGADAPSFVDGDAPAGIVDGSNTAFGLSAVPDPTSSLAVYRNGMLQKIGQDYTLSGNTVTFVRAATPQPGDTLLASYRLNSDSGSPGTFSSLQVLCSGTGTNVTSAALTLLGTCSIPAGVLAAGDRVEIRFDYAHQGAAGGFSIEVDWGATTLVHRDAAASETLVTGRGSAAILASGAQLSAESWGTTLALAAGAASAADNYSAGIAVNFMGSVAKSGDSVVLNGFSVVRVP